MKSASEKPHAKLSASGSDRWLNCPGSVQLSEKAPPQKESEYAREGTDAHFCLEMILKSHGKRPRVAAELLKKKYPETMVNHAWNAYKEITQRLPDGATLLCETQVDLSFVGPDMFGTTDSGVVEEFGRLRVIDYKYGAGIPVDPQDNSQLIYYALGLAHQYNYNFSEVVLTIIQPRAEHARGPIREHIMQIDELIKWKDTFTIGVERCADPLAELNPNPDGWCRFCPAKTICPALSDHAFEEAQIDFSPDESHALALPAVDTVQVDRIANVLMAATKIEAWIKAVKEHALDLANSGCRIPGFKVVKKRSTRKWIDEDKAMKLAQSQFGEGVFSVEFLSPAQLEKTFVACAETVKTFIKENSNSESSGVTLVPDTDSRPEFNTITADYDELETGEEEIMAKKKAAKSTRKTTTKQKTIKTAKRTTRK